MTRPLVNGLLSCTRCQRLKDPSEFPPNPRMHHGRNSWCRPCQVENTRYWRAAHRAEYRARANAHYAAHRENEQANSRRRWRALHPLSERSCPTCATHFTPARRNSQIYCTDTCRVAFRASQRSTKPAKHVRLRILNRDNWTCYLCGLPIDRFLRWPHPLSPSVDHVVPVSAGGSDRDDNLRATHWTCNEAKGEQLPGIEVWIPGGLTA